MKEYQRTFKNFLKKHILYINNLAFGGNYENQII